MPAVTAASTPSASSRSTSSPAARRVNVTASTWRGLGELLADAERDATREHAGLARAGGREDRERRVRLGDRGALVRVEIGEQRVVVRHACDRTGRLRRSSRRGAEAPETREGPE